MAVKVDGVWLSQGMALLTADYLKRSISCKNAGLEASFFSDSSILIHFKFMGKHTTAIHLKTSPIKFTKYGKHTV